VLSQITSTGILRKKFKRRIKQHCRQEMKKMIYSKSKLGTSSTLTLALEKARKLLRKGQRSWLNFQKKRTFKQPNLR
jgi:hypothetical protein